MTDGAAPAQVRFAAQFWSQATDWPTLRDAALRAEATGWDSVWTWDHLNAIFGPWDQPVFEGWSVLAALAPITTRVRLGLMVGANTFRNPGLTAKLATTLDHLSGGRAVLGIGAAWFEREHEAFGIDFGRSPGERIARLEEALGLLRRLLDGETVTHEGRFYTMHEALCAPRPIQARLPILVGASGRTKSIPLTGRIADGWNSSGTVEDMEARLAILEAAARETGRDPAAIERTVSFQMVIRDDREAAEAAFAALLAHNGAAAGPGVTLLGPPEAVAETLRPYVALGFGTVIVRLPAPYDVETLERMREVRTLLGAAPAGGTSREPARSGVATSTAGG